MANIFKSCLMIVKTVNKMKENNAKFVLQMSSRLTVRAVNEEKRSNRLTGFLINESVVETRSILRMKAFERRTFCRH